MSDYYQESDSPNWNERVLILPGNFMQGELRHSIRAGYGAASVGLGAIELMLQVYLLDLYILAGLNPSVAGLAIAIAVFWDAISDPLMGVISDKTPAKSVAGRRIPYLAAGAALVSIAFSFLFSPPINASQTALFTNLLIWYLLVNTAMTLFSVPHLAIVNDLASTDQERASLFGWRIALGSVGLLAGIGLPAYLATKSIGNSIATTLDLRSLTGLIIGIIAAVGCLLTSLVVSYPLRHKASEGRVSSPKTTGIFSMVKMAMRSRAFPMLTLGFVAIAMGRSFNSSLALPYYKSRLGFDDQQIGIVLLVLTTTIIIAAPCWVVASRRASKSMLFFSAASLLAILSAFAYPLLPKDLINPALIVAFIGGVFVSSIVLLDSLFSDFVELEKTTHSLEVSGAYYGIWRMLAKISRALGIGCSGLLLSAIGYQEGALEQETSVEKSIAWAFGPGVAAFLAIGALIVKRVHVRGSPPLVENEYAVSQ